MTDDMSDEYTILSTGNLLRLSDIRATLQRGENCLRGVIDHNRCIAVVTPLDIDHRQIQKHPVFADSRQCDLWGFRIETHKSPDRFINIPQYSILNSSKKHTQGFYDHLYALVYSLIDFEDAECPEDSPTSEEIIDIIDEDDPNEIVGCALKSEIHTQGLPHRVCAILLQREDGAFIIPTAAAIKVIDRGFYHSAAGHIRSGEKSTTAAIRELREECGLIVDIKDIALIGGYWLERKHPAKNEYEYFDVYCVRYRQDMGEIICNNEQINPQWITYDELVRMLKGHSEEFSIPLQATIEQILMPQFDSTPQR